MTKASLFPSGTSPALVNPKRSTQKFRQGSISSTNSTAVTLFTAMGFTCSSPCAETMVGSSESTRIGRKICGRIGIFSLSKQLVLFRLVKVIGKLYACQGGIYARPQAPFAGLGFRAGGDASRF